jgi:hypothetical protein
MRKLGLWAVGVLAVFVVGCVEAEPDRTNVVINRDAAPAAHTTVVHDGAKQAPDTKVNVDVDTSAKTPDVIVEK